MKRVYLSGPITKGCRSTNFHVACVAQQKLMYGGFAVLNPMLTMLHPEAARIPWEIWIAGDLDWIEVADLVIRLPGESEGADVETAHAEKHGIEVVRVADCAALDAFIESRQEDEMEV